MSTEFLSQACWHRPIAVSPARTQLAPVAKCARLTATVVRVAYDATASERLRAETASRPRGPRDIGGETTNESTPAPRPTPANPATWVSQSRAQADGIRTWQINLKS